MQKVVLPSLHAVHSRRRKRWQSQRNVAREGPSRKPCRLTSSLVIDTETDRGCSRPNEPLFSLTRSSRESDHHARGDDVSCTFVSSRRVEPTVTGIVNRGTAAEVITTIRPYGSGTRRRIVGRRTAEITLKGHSEKLDLIDPRSSSMVFPMVAVSFARRRRKPTLKDRGESSPPV